VKLAERLCHKIQPINCAPVRVLIQESQEQR